MKLTSTQVAILTGTLTLVIMLVCRLTDPRLLITVPAAVAGLALRGTARYSRR